MIESADGVLEIFVCRAKHLPNKLMFDKQSPFVTLRVGVSSQQTKKHYRAGQTPEWNETLSFSLTKERRPIVKLEVYHEKKQNLILIGHTEIDCSVIFVSPDSEKRNIYVYNDWHNLKQNGKWSGTIYLEMKFYPKLGREISHLFSDETQQCFKIENRFENPTLFKHKEHYLRKKPEGASKSEYEDRIEKQTSFNFFSTDDKDFEDGEFYEEEEDNFFFQQPGQLSKLQKETSSFMRDNYDCSNSNSSSDEHLKTMFHDQSSDAMDTALLA